MAEVLPMSSILFFDQSCQHPYDTRTLQQKATGGTEASVTRIADALDAFVVQHNRTEAYGRYRPPERISGIEHVVLNRDSRALPIVREVHRSPAPRPTSNVPRACSGGS